MKYFSLVFSVLIFFSCNYQGFSKRKYLPRFKTEHRCYEEEQVSVKQNIRLHNNGNAMLRSRMLVDKPLKPYNFQHLFHTKIAILEGVNHKRRNLTRSLQGKFFSPKVIWYEGEDDDYARDNKGKQELLKKQIYRLLLAFFIGLISYLGIGLLPFLMAYKAILEYDGRTTRTLQRIGQVLFVLNLFLTIVAGFLLLLFLAALTNPSVVLWLESIPFVIYTTFFSLTLIVWIISFFYAVFVLFHLLRKLNELKQEKATVGSRK